MERLAPVLAPQQGIVQGEIGIFAEVQGEEFLCCQDGDGGAVTGDVDGRSVVLSAGTVEKYGRHASEFLLPGL